MKLFFPTYAGRIQGLYQLNWASKWAHGAQPDELWATKEIKTSFLMLFDLLNVRQGYLRVK